MHRTGSGITLRAGKPRPLGEVQIQVQALAIGTELGAHHPPRLGQAKSSLEQVNLRHRQSSPTVKGRTLTLPAPGHHYPHDSAKSPSMYPRNVNEMAWWSSRRLLSL